MLFNQGICTSSGMLSSVVLLAWEPCGIDSPRLTLLRVEMTGLVVHKALKSDCGATWPFKRGRGTEESGCRKKPQL